MVQNADICFLPVDRFGRRNTILAAGYIFLIGVALQTAAPNVATLFVGRAVGGFALAWANIAVQIYTTECSPAEIRGTVVGIQQVMLTMGAAMAYWINYGLALHQGTLGNAIFRIPFGLQFLPVVLMIFFVSFLPKSPRWLVLHDRDDDARKSLANLWSTDPSDDRVITEVAQIRTFSDAHPDATWTQVFSKTNFPRISVAVSLILFQQFTGQNLILYYAPRVFAGLGISSSTSGLLATGVVGLVKFTMSIFSILIIDTFGRRPLLLSGTLLMVIAFFYIGAETHIMPVQTLNGASITGIVMVYVFILAYSYSWGTCHYIIVSEVLTNELRAKCQVLTGGTDWLFQYVTIQASSSMLKNLGGRTYFAFATFNTFFLIYFYFFLPETAQHKLEGMSSAFKESKVVGATLVEKDPDQEQVQQQVENAIHQVHAEEKS